MSGDEGARREYWREQMELGYDLVQQIAAWPVEECGEPFADLQLLAMQQGVPLLFSESLIGPGLSRIFWIRQSLAADVLKIAEAVNQRGWILKIEDCYRTLAMQRTLGSRAAIFDAVLRKCLWETGGKMPDPELLFRRCSVLVAIVPKVGTHMSASAIDISVYRCSDGVEVWRGNPYLEMSERTPMRSPFVEPEFTQNRLTITSILEEHGFMHFPYEFWHYNKGDALWHILTGTPGPAKYGPVHWDAARNEVRAVERSEEPLRPVLEIERELQAAVERMKGGGHVAV